MKRTAVASSNLALIKYWGKKDEVLRLPTNGSISMNLSNLTTTTTVEFSNKYTRDEIIIDNTVSVNRAKRVIDQLDRIRKLAGIKLKAKVMSKNNFPMSTGLSSSASGFAALTMAAVSASGLELSEKELTIVARQGSGSACRSIPSGWVEWIEGNSSETSYAQSIFPPNWWDIIDIVVLLSNKEKEVSTSEGQKYIQTSQFFKTRLSLVNNKIRKVKQYIKTKDFIKFGELVEAEALELHSIMLTSYPALIYLFPETLIIIKEVQRWRKEGLAVYFSLSTGHNLHLLCLSKTSSQIYKRVKKFSFIKKIILNKVGKGAKLIDKDLF